MAAELLRRLILAVLAYGGAWYLAAQLVPVWQAACAPLLTALGQ